MNPLSDIPLYYNSYGTECAQHFGFICAHKYELIPSEEQIKKYVTKSNNKTYTDTYWNKLYTIAFNEAWRVLYLIRKQRSQYIFNEETLRNKYG